jgi:predicted metal-dependent hydrolase
MQPKLNYIKSARVRRVSIVIGSSSEVNVKMPFGVSDEKARKFVESKKEWIEKTLAKFRRREKKFEGALKLPKGSSADLKIYKREAKKLVEEKIQHFNALYGFEYKKITIRNTSSRWGSASKKGNLSFSYRIVMLPPELADYLVVHELCHLGEMNHGANFWALVAKSIPDYKKRRKQLRLVRSV